MTKKVPIPPFIEGVHYTVNENGCWLWSRGSSPEGYGKVRYKGRLDCAHRASFEIAFGRIGEGLHICHKCDVPACINPDHLFAGTRQDNMRDMVKKGRENPHGRRVTHCPAGHEYTAENTAHNKKGRTCLKCRANRTKLRSEMRAKARALRPTSGQFHQCEVCMDPRGEG